MKPPEPAAEFFTALALKGSKRLIPPQQLRFHGQCSGQCHTLSLPSGELTGITTSHRLQLHECEQFTDPLLYASCRRSQRSRLHRKPKGHILSHGHMPEQRVMLENEPHATFSDSPIRRLRAVQKDTSSIRFFQSGKNSQQRR